MRYEAISGQREMTSLESIASRLGTRRSVKAKSPTATIQVAASAFSIEQGQNKFVITRYTLNMKSRL